jgi:hypothetical protein
MKTFPEIAERLFSEAEEEAREKYDKYRRMAEGNVCF